MNEVKSGMTQTRTKLASAGFSLVELMVVVAIIGVLAAVAVPRISRFINKARTTEAQVNLGSIYTFNKNFFVEFQGYTCFFAAMGFQPEGKLRYNIGFTGCTVFPANYTASGRPSPLGGFISTLAACTQVAGDGSFAAGQNCGTMLGATNAPPPALLAQHTVNNGTSDSVFLAGARAQLTNNSTGNIDLWEIDHNKRLQNILDGTQ